MLFQVGKKYRFLTRDNLRFGGEILAVEDGLVRLHDQLTNKDIILPVDGLLRVEENK